MMARTYHPFEFPEFAKLGLWIVLKLLSQGPGAVTKSTEVAAKLGRVNAGCYGYSLLGLYLVFLGFCFQLLGATITSFAGQPRPALPAILPLNLDCVSPASLARLAA